MHSYAQHGEDIYLNTLFKGVNNGVCIEIGAYDGVCCSNTNLFEQKGWRALCIEPNEDMFKKCQLSRKESINCCISSDDTEDTDFHIFCINGDNFGAISGLKPDVRLIESHRHMINYRKTCNVKVRSLTSLLDEINYPTDIDFISIDTENTELDVLRGIDFKKYNIKVLVVENNYDEDFCEDYLQQFGYKKIRRIAVNDFFMK